MKTTQHKSVVTAILVVLVALLQVCCGKYIESVAANIDGPSSKPTDPRNHAHFVPLVAFHCGYRNKFMNKKGDWEDDPSSFASCLEAKYDILKYCKRVYPDQEITNIVEYGHLSHIDNWCKEESGANCNHHFIVRPYRCIVGEFQTESLQVPSKCHFSHVTGRDKCNEYKYWNIRAESECSLKIEEETKQSMKLRSFAILEPCGLDMFRGVEYVCCPKSIEDNIDKVIDLDKDTDDDDYDDDEEEENTKQDDQDPYFKESSDDSENEHKRFRAAEERLEKMHRKKVTKVISEWSELFERYNKMKESDPKGAEEYKRSMTAKFRKTVAALEAENRERRTQIEDLHDERVQASLNEKKRLATHDYRAALAVQVGGSNKNNVLRTLKNYIKAEEKDRTHMLNRYRHLLRSDPEAATNFEPVLLHRLRYIDLRINGTLAMLRDFPSLEKEVRAEAMEFWQNYRRDNTPEVSAEEAKEASELGADERNERLIRLYKKYYERNHPSTQLAFMDVKPGKSKKLPSVQHVVALKDVLSEKNDDSKKTEVIPEDSDEDQFEEDEDSPVSSTSAGTKKPADEVKVKTMTQGTNVKKAASFSPDENADDEDDESEELNTPKRELSVSIEPIVQQSPKQDQGLPAYARQDLLMTDEKKYYTEPPYYGSGFSSQTNFGLAATAFVFLLMSICFCVRRRSITRGFIEVDVCTPEERHISGMRVNGYENPTYTFFDAKA